MFTIFGKIEKIGTQIIFFMAEFSGRTQVLNQRSGRIVGCSKKREKEYQISFYLKVNPPQIHINNETGT